MNSADFYCWINGTAKEAYRHIIRHLAHGCTVICVLRPILDDSAGDFLYSYRVFPGLEVAITGPAKRPRTLIFWRYDGSGS